MLPINNNGKRVYSFDMHESEPKRLRPVDINPELPLKKQGFVDLDQVRQFLEENGRELTALNLQGFDLTDEEFLSLIQCCPHITSLSVTSAKLTDRAVVQACSWSNRLTQLDLTDCCLITDESVEAICVHLTALTELNLTCIRSLSSASVTAIAKNLKGLTKLCLRDDQIIYSVNNIDVMTILHYLPQLTYLDLSGWADLTDNCVTSICRGLPDLKALILNNCNQLTQKTVDVISQIRPNLEELELASVIDIPGQSFVEFFPRVTQLKNLNVEDCNLDDEVLQQLTACCQKLETLVLARVFGISSSSMQTLSRLTMLKDLDLCATQVEVNVLKQIAPNLPLLEFLDLQQHQLTGEDVRDLVQNLPHLQRLELAGCQNIRSKSLKQLKADFPHIEFNW